MKESTLLKALFWFAVFTAPLHNTFYTILFLLASDMITGIWAASKKNEAITSHRLADTFNKMLLYNLGVLVCFALELNIFTEIPLVKIAAGTVAMIELKSLFENIAKVTGRDIWPQIWEAMKEGLRVFKKPSTGAVFILILFAGCSPKVQPISETQELKHYDTIMPGDFPGLPLNTPFLLPLPDGPIVITNTPEGLRAQGSRQIETKTVLVNTGKVKTVDKSQSTTQIGEGNVSGEKVKKPQTQQGTDNTLGKVKTDASGFKIPWYVWLFIVLCVAALIYLKFL